MNKEFVPYEQALALKELGFDESCFGYYDDQIKKLDTISSEVCERLCKHDTHIKAPTFSQAFRWFREKYNLNAISPTRIYKTDFYQCRIINWSNWEEIYPKQCNTYEEAELACLNKLIEIVKTNETLH